MGLFRDAVRAIKGRTIEPSAIHTEEQTINDSVTYPDDRTFTGSPSGENVTEVDLAGQSEVDITDGIDSAYRVELRFVDVNFVSGTPMVTLQFSTDGGSTWVSGSEDYKYVSKRIDSGNNEGSNASSGDSRLQLDFADTEDADNNTLEATVIVPRPGTDVKQNAHWQGTYFNPTGKIESFSGGGATVDPAAVDAIRIGTTDSDFEAGTVAVVKQ